MNNIDFGFLKPAQEKVSEFRPEANARMATVATLSASALALVSNLQTSLMTDNTPAAITAAAIVQTIGNKFDGVAGAAISEVKKSTMEQKLNAGLTSIGRSDLTVSFRRPKPGGFTPS